MAKFVDLNLQHSKTINDMIMKFSQLIRVYGTNICINVHVYHINSFVFIEENINFELKKLKFPKMRHLFKKKGA